VGIPARRAANEQRNKKRNRPGFVLPLRRVLARILACCSSRVYVFCFLTPAQRHSFACAAGCTRLVWNTALALQLQRRQHQQPLLSYRELSLLLKLWKHEKPFLKEAPSQALQQRLIDLSQAIEEARDPKNPKQFPAKQAVGIFLSKPSKRSKSSNTHRPLSWVAILGWFIF
jgi:hypothetical protein